MTLKFLKLVRYKLYIYSYILLIITLKDFGLVAVIDEILYANFI